MKTKINFNKLSKGEIQFNLSYFKCMFGFHNYINEYEEVELIDKNGDVYGVGAMQLSHCKKCGKEKLTYIGKDKLKITEKK